MRVACLVAVCAFMAAACNTQERRLTEQLASLEQRHADASRRVADRTNAIAESERKLERLNGDLTAQNTEVHAFLAGHKIAAACIQASRATWGSDDAIANELTAMSRVGSALCSVALLNAEFAREVEYVTGRLREADVRVKHLKEQIAAAKEMLDNERAELRRDQDAADGIAAEMADVKWQLDGR